MNNKSVNLCTVVNKEYVFKFMAVYYSLKDVEEKFSLWTLCIDRETYSILSKLKLKKVKLINLKEVEDEKLKSVKKERTEREYAWTSKPAFIYNLLKNNKNIEEIIYTDADMGFFESPRKIVESVNSHSVGITHHNFPKSLEYKGKQVGEYNSGIVYFKNNKTGRACCKFWKDKCIEFCYYKPHRLGVGDQMYLGLFPKKFPDTYVFKNKAINFGPWSIGSTSLKLKDKKVLVNNKPLICYHFHQFQTHSPEKFTLVIGYQIPNILNKSIYTQYQEYIKKGIIKINEVDPSYKYGFQEKKIEESLINNTIRYIQPIYSKLINKLGIIYKTYKE